MTAILHVRMIKKKVPPRLVTGRNFLFISGEKDVSGPSG